MKPLTAKEVEEYLKEAGYTFSRTEGSHFIWKTVTTGHAIPIPHHGNKPLRQGLLNSIFRACGIDKPQR